MMHWLHKYTSLYVIPVVAEIKRLPSTKVMRIDNGSTFVLLH